MATMWNPLEVLRRDIDRAFHNAGFGTSHRFGPPFYRVRRRDAIPL